MYRSFDALVSAVLFITVLVFVALSVFKIENSLVYATRASSMDDVAESAINYLLLNANDKTRLLNKTFVQETLNSFHDYMRSSSRSFSDVGFVVCVDEVTISNYNFQQSLDVNKTISNVYCIGSKSHVSILPHGEATRYIVVNREWSPDVLLIIHVIAYLK